MAVAFVNAATPTPFNSTNQVLAASAQGALGTCILFVLAFENVAAGSGPWVVPNTTTAPSPVVGPATGWLLAGFQAPSATGVGLEAWIAIEGVSPPQGTRTFNLVSSLSGVVVGAKWSGVYAPSGSINDGGLRGSAFQAWTGNAPQSPAVTSPVSGDLVVPIGAMLMQTPGFGTPTGSGNEGAYTNRTDAERSGFGTGEAVIGDAQVNIGGTTGAITWPGTAATGTTHGAMGTLNLRAAPIVTTSTGVVMDFTYPSV